jgi:hypothetical protein
MRRVFLLPGASPTSQRHVHAAGLLDPAKRLTVMSYLLIELCWTQVAVNCFWLDARVLREQTFNQKGGVLALRVHILLRWYSYDVIKLSRRVPAARSLCNGLDLQGALP